MPISLMIWYVWTSLVPLFQMKWLGNQPYVNIGADENRLGDTCKIGVYLNKGIITVMARRSSCDRWCSTFDKYARNNRSGSALIKRLSTRSAQNGIEKAFLVGLWCRWAFLGKTIVGLRCMSLVHKNIDLANNQTAVNHWLWVDKTDLTEDMVGAIRWEKLAVQ